MSHAQENKAQFSQQVKTFIGSPHANQAEAIERFMTLAGPAKGERALDVACGPGIIAEALARRGAEVTGVDVTPAMVEAATARLQKAGFASARFVEGDAEKLPFEDGTFDLVTSRLAFHHLARPDRVLREMVRVAKPEGRIAIFDLITSEDPARAAFHNLVERLRDPSHARALSVGEVVLRFEEAGLVLERFDGMDYDIDVDDWVGRSFPRPGEGEEAKRLIREVIGTDRFAFRKVWEEDGVLHFHARWGMFLGVRRAV